MHTIKASKQFVIITESSSMSKKWPGSVHDARVFANSEVQKNYSEKKLNLFYKELLPDEEWVPQVLLADPAYPLLP